MGSIHTDRSDEEASKIFKASSPIHEIMGQSESQSMFTDVSCKTYRVHLLVVKFLEQILSQFDVIRIGNLAGIGDEQLQGLKWSVRIPHVRRVNKTYGRDCLGVWQHQLAEGISACFRHGK